MTDLPNRDLLRPEEVAEHWRVTIRTVYLWVENRHLEIVRTPGGAIRITRESCLKCRFPPPED